MRELASGLYLLAWVGVVFGFLWLIQRSAFISALKAHEKWKASQSLSSSESCEKRSLGALSREPIIKGP